MKYLNLILIALSVINLFKIFTCRYLIIGRMTLFSIKYQINGDKSIQIPIINISNRMTVPNVLIALIKKMPR